MSDFTPNSPIENIGALEWSSVAYGLADGTLEATAASLSAPTSANNCGTVWPCAQRIDDSALENAAVTVTAGPTIAPCTVMTCPRIDDGALEASAGPVTPTGGAWTQFCCRRIDDGALEAVAVTGPGQTIITYCGCGHVDDGELEAAIDAPVPTTVHTGCYHIRVNDSELEATAGILHANPTGAGNICNMSGPLMCPRRIEDGVN